MGYLRKYGLSRFGADICSTKDPWKMWITFFKKEFPVENLLMPLDFGFESFIICVGIIFDPVVIVWMRGIRRRIET